MTSTAADDEFVIIDHQESGQTRNEGADESIASLIDDAPIPPPFSVIISSAGTESSVSTISLLNYDSPHPHPINNVVSPSSATDNAAISPALVTNPSNLSPNPRLYAPRPSRSRKGSSHDAWASAYLFAQNESGGKHIKESIDLVFPYTPPPVGAGRSLSPLPGAHGRKVSAMPLQPHEHPLYDKMKGHLRAGLSVGQRLSVYKRLLALYGDSRLEAFESDYGDWRSETFQGMELTIQAFPSLPTFGSTVKWNNFGVPFNSIGVPQSAPSGTKEEQETKPQDEENEQKQPTSADDGGKKEKLSDNDPLSRYRRRSSLALRRFAVPYEISHATKLILCVVSHLSPDVTYCPLILDLIVYFLSIGVTENQSFALVYTMIKRSLKDEYWMPLVPKSWSKMIHCMAAIIEKKDSSLCQFITKDLGVDIKRDLIDPWMRRLFVSFLPLPAVIRIIDCWLLEGSKVFYRVLLSLFKIHRAQIMKCDPSEQKPLDYINALLSHTPTELLIKTAFDIFLQRKELLKITSSIGHLSFLPSASPIFHIPRFTDGSSDILNRDLCFQLWSWLPQDIRIRDPQLIYSAARHGYRFNTMAEKGAGLSHPLLMIIKAGIGSVVGAFIPAAWTMPLASLPLNLDGRSFVFTLSPHRKVFRHVKYATRKSMTNLQELDNSDSEEENDQNEESLSISLIPSSAPPAPPSPKSPTIPPPIMHKSVKLSPLVEADEDFKEAGVTSNDLASLRNKLLAGKPKHDSKEDPLANLLAVAGTLKGVQLSGRDIDKLHAHTWSGALQQTRQRRGSGNAPVEAVHHKLSGDTFSLPSLKRSDTGLFETFMMMNDQFFAIGDSTGFALSFDKEMKIVNSAPTAGFRSPTLLKKRTHRLTASSADASVAALTSSAAIQFALGMTSQPAETVSLPIIELELWTFAIPSH